MRRPIRRILIAGLALIGASVIALNVGVNLGMVPVCESPIERAMPSPGGNTTAIFGVANCGSSRRHLTVRLIGNGGGSGSVFSGYTASPNATIEGSWLSLAELEVRYSQGMEVDYPSNGLGAINTHGAVNVTFIAL